MNQSKFAFLITFAFSVSVQAAQTEWESWVEQKAAQPSPVIQARAVEKTGRIQLWGPAVGTSERRDLYSNYFGSIAGRYFFTEHHGWEVLRTVFNMPSRASIVDDITSKTNYQLDAQASYFSISSSYVFSPIYGKYAWGDDTLIHFDMYALAGMGLRFARNTQVFGELGTGMAHYLSSHFAIAPEVRWRLYQEQRATNVLVSEVSFQLGASWLF
jgi:outer membrane beta-barrel protein